MLSICIQLIFELRNVPMQQLLYCVGGKKKKKKGYDLKFCWAVFFLFFFNYYYLLISILLGWPCCVLSFTLILLSVKNDELQTHLFIFKHFFYSKK